MQVACRWLWGRIEVALGWLQGGLKVALGCLSPGYQYSLGWLWEGLPGFSRFKVRCAPSACQIQLPIPASLGVVWGSSGTTLVPPYTHRTRQEPPFQSGKVIQIAKDLGHMFVRQSLRVDSSLFASFALSCGRDAFKSPSTTEHETSGNPCQE
jgi:hypothetical protein